MDKTQVEKAYDEIISFSGLEGFIEQPIKTYSNGMYLRLAFSVFAHFETDILLLDEVFSVGDAEFQLKSMEKIKELAKKGTTIIMVNHNMDAIEEVSNRCILLENGQVIKDDHTHVVSDYYLEKVVSKSIEGDLGDKKRGIKRSKHSIEWTIPEHAPKDDWIRFRSRKIYPIRQKDGEIIYMEDEFVIEYAYEVLKNQTEVLITTNILNSKNERIITHSHGLLKDYTTMTCDHGLYIEKIKIPGNIFNKGTYFISLTVANHYHQKDQFLEIPEILVLRIRLNQWEESRFISRLISSDFRMQLDWTREKSLG